MQSIYVTPPATTTRHTPAPLLDHDPDLGALLRDEREASARRDVQVGVHEIAGGEWNPAAHLSAARCAIGLLIISGAVVREITIDDQPSAELLGPGDLIRTTPQDDPASAGGDITWTALTPCLLCPLDAPATRSIARYPEIMLTLMERIEARAQRLAVTQAISQMTGVDHRLQTLFWHLAESWGKVRHDGVLIPLDLSHQLLGKLIGARRPTVSTALALLAHQQRITRRPDGTWLLHRTDTRLNDPLEISFGTQPASWHRVAA
jgi:CRP-like cAMP-binding protein